VGAIAPLVWAFQHLLHTLMPLRQQGKQFLIQANNSFNMSFHQLSEGNIIYSHAIGLSWAKHMTRGEVKVDKLLEKDSAPQAQGHNLLLE
jgi:hypothetical protein